MESIGDYSTQVMVSDSEGPPDHDPRPERLAPEVVPAGEEQQDEKEDGNGCCHVL